MLRLRISRQGAHQLKCPRIGSSDRQKHGDERPGQGDGSDHKANEAEWFFGPAVSAFDGRRPIDGGSNGSGEFQA